MTALFNFQSLLLVIILLVCTSTYVHQIFPAILDRNKDGIMGIFWKCARIGERLSPYVSICCVLMAKGSRQSASPDGMRMDSCGLEGNTRRKQQGDSQESRARMGQESGVLKNTDALRLSKLGTQYIRPITLAGSRWNLERVGAISPSYQL
ncbi:hypothetical protein QBC45DRAFT_384590 [Copromyces sp. CBS 386.78]|nr:hypothetical protein QBC45DRAFT_384590 [Copromyces sp. CBS 386.78]